ncbi:tyrosine-type recombinase/integrase [Vitreoscilla stercoraria]|uniref:Tyrosine-type recombinase/integrase n=1 Tax=Vitreoscilla stercoraria TaxID=61 RepID=A0ABY4EA86_VITST|nr:integrase arm-type DNA-binding domain-containing protein [Vitreoscilla stercoraria]UOO92671.1 tyrosine-type recombinase/integrase [Vitreoscilla stercoraria]
MPKIAKRLTDTAVKALKPKEKTYKVAGGNGLSLFIKPNGSKLWAFRFIDKVTQKDCTVYLGSYPAYSLAEATKWADELKQRHLKGLAVIEEKPDTDKYVFQTVYQSWFERWQPTVTPRHALQVQSVIEKDIFPTLSSMDVREIKPVNIVDALRVFEERGALERLRRTKNALNLLFGYAVSGGLIDANPVASVQNNAFKKPVKGQFDALPQSDLPMLMKWLGEPITIAKLAIKWQLMTLCRPIEAVGARFDEMDLANKLWVIPANRMKRGKTHTIPLTDALIELLDLIQYVNQGGVYLFESLDGDSHLHRESPRLALRKAKFNTTAHGLRSTASTILNESRLFREDVIEVQLSHADTNKVRSAYNRSDYLQERLEMLQWWHDYLAQQEA